MTHQKPPSLFAPKSPTPKSPTPKSPTPKTPTPKSPTPKTPTPKSPSKMPSITQSLFKNPSKSAPSFIDNVEDKIATPMTSAFSATSTSVTSGSRSWKFWLGIIFLLALLGFNIFTYAGDIVEYIKKLFAPILSAFGYTVGETSKMTIDTVAKGSTEMIDATANIATSGINVLESALTNIPNSRTSYNKLSDTNNSNSALNNIEKNITSKPRATPIPDEANSRTQTNRAAGKSGFCYVGEQNNIRSCVKVK